jgi:hypothetical protein
MSPHRDIDHLEDWAVETHESISARLEGAKAAQTQTRLTLGTMAVISMMMLIASYNAYLSYDYNWITEARCQESKAAGESNISTEQTSGPNTLTEQAPTAADETRIFKEQAYKDWAASRTILISILGIRVSVDDAAVLGTAVLFVLSLWLLLVARRENHTIGFLLRDTDTPRRADKREPSDTPSKERRLQADADGERWLIYHTIISNSLFVIFDRLPHVRTLIGPNSLRVTTRRRGGSWRDKVGFRPIRDFFFWFPVVASGVVFSLDWWSYFSDDPFNPGCVPDRDSSFFWRTRVVFLMCWVPMTICCMRSNRYSRATERVLRKYGRRLFANLKRKQAAKS